MRSRKDMKILNQRTTDQHQIKRIMKTSNKLTIAAILFILVSLVYYDLMLKASYLSGTYRDQFKDYTILNFKDFNSIDLGASTAANIIVEQGPFRVRIG